MRLSELSESDSIVGNCERMLKQQDAYKGVSVGYNYG